MLAFLWMKQQLSFKNLSHWDGFNIWMTFSLFGQMRSNSLRSFLMTLVIITLILNSLKILIKNISFLDLKVPLSRVNLSIDSHVNLADSHFNISTLHLQIQIIQNVLLFLVKSRRSVGYVHMRNIMKNMESMKGCFHARSYPEHLE